MVIKIKTRYRIRLPKRIDIGLIIKDIVSLLFYSWALTVLLSMAYVHGWMPFHVERVGVTSEIFKDIFWNFTVWLTPIMLFIKGILGRYLITLQPGSTQSSLNVIAPIKRKYDNVSGKEEGC